MTALLWQGRWGVLPCTAGLNHESRAALSELLNPLAVSLAGGGGTTSSSSFCYQRPQIRIYTEKKTGFAQIVFGNFQKKLEILFGKN